MTTLVTDAISALSAGSEPWPSNVKLFQPYEDQQILLPDFANCLSVKALLRMNKLPYQVELRVNAESMSPTGKLPFLKVGPFLVSEYAASIAFIRAKGHSLSDALNKVELAEMRAYMALVENVLVNAELYFTWCEKIIRNEVTKSRYGSLYCWPLNILLPLKKQYEVNRMLTSIGWAKKTFDEVCEDVTMCCQALSEILGDHLYFFGDSPTELDALVFGHLYSLLTTNLPVTRIAETIQQFSNLLRFCQHIDMTFFKDKQLQWEN
ncbi:Metaxin-2 [Lamellibrachia satsuma]|nr:Metaxin-2 [Lamellibrachia satsuma]